MNAYECYCDYVSLKLHFTKWEYDYFLLEGHTNTSVATFEKRKDRYWFKKLADLRFPHKRLLAHCCINEHFWVREVVTEPEVYLQWQGRQDTLTMTFIREISKLKKVFDANFLFTPGMHPYLVREYLGKRISLETLTIISDLTDCVSYWGQHADEDPIFETVIRRILKYTKFLEYDMEKYRKILIDSLE